METDYSGYVEKSGGKEMKRFCVKGWFFCLLSIILGSVQAATPEETFNQANASFVSGKYSDAIQGYESLIAQNIYSASLLYNLANAYDRDEKVGLAILNYERALWLKPNDADIKANLQFVRQHAGLFEPEIVWWQILPHFFSLNRWALIFSVSLTLFCVCLSIRILRKDWRWNFRPMILVFSFILIVSALSMRWKMSDLNRGVTMDMETSLRVAPFEGSPPIFTLSAGHIVHVQKSRDDFHYVRTEDGKLGWISGKQIQWAVPYR